MIWIGLIWLRIGTNSGLLRTQGSVKHWKILQQLSDWRLLKKDSALPDDGQLLTEVFIETENFLWRNVSM
jgi:hypothetical protein